MRYTLAAAMTLAASVAMVATFSGRIDASTGPIPLNFSVGRTQREQK